MANMARKIFAWACLLIIGKNGWEKIVDFELNEDRTGRISIKVLMQ